MFTLRDIPDLSGKVAIVTGANGGIGYITARELARHKAHVFVAGRNKSSCEEAVEKIRKETGNENVEFLELDLANLNQVKQSAENWLKRNLKLHILVNNAGIMCTPFRLSVDGIEEQFATNHLGHFLLTRTLLPTIENSAPSRIVNVSSKYHQGAPKNGIDFENLNLEGAHPSHTLYGQTKLANILFTTELNKRLQGKNVYVNSVHPGFIPHTGLAKGLGESYGGFFQKIYESLSIFTMSIEDGALTQLYLGTSNEIEEKNYRGEYFIPIAKLSKPSHKMADDEELAKKLWEFSEQIVNEKLS